MNQRVGQILRRAREEQDIALEAVSQATHIRQKHLEALEAGEFGALPSAVQVRGFLTSYAEYLGLDAKKLLSSLSSSDVPEPETESEEDQPAGRGLPASIAGTQTGREASQIIFEEIGATIRARREMLGLSLDDIADNTRIPTHYVSQIEAGGLDDFPSPAQARGMLNNYVDFLEMNSNAVMLRYAEALQARLNIPAQPVPTPSTESVVPEPKAERSPIGRTLRRVFSADTLIFSVVGFSLVVFIIWGIGRILSTQASQEAQATIPVADGGGVLATEALTPVDEGPTEAATQPEQAAGGADNGADIPDQPVVGAGEVSLFLVIRQRTYLRVTVDGEVEFDGRAEPGTTMSFDGQEQIELLTGNAAAIQVFYNELDLGPMGIFGEVANVIYSPASVITPTATITPTPGPEDQLTPTPTTTPGP